MNLDVSERATKFYSITEAWPIERCSIGNASEGDSKIKSHCFGISELLVPFHSILLENIGCWNVRNYGDGRFTKKGICEKNVR